ncbi:hypothetical protein GpartN1_g5506.t1 [Galdieria partita]|uniref:NADH-cytochrome b5 reductase n=1 Tax=Galdieria partita TaxID=83374 RepID=A0A9C7Q0B1_9RHOD|nr:hypothetical protein GpartN1_g5506.t1 [Galdieria partita]
MKLTEWFKLESLHISSSPLLLSVIGIFVLLVTSFVRILRKLYKGKSFHRDDFNSLALDPLDFRSFKLIEKAIVTPNVRLFRFAASHPEQLVNVPLGKHIYAKAWINGKEVRRPYNPINKPNQVGYFDILVKIYPAPYGLFSRYLDSLEIGDCVEFRGPKGKFEYKRNMKKRLGMIAGGTGITPMFQLIDAILNDPLERTQISLIYANHTEQDIIFRNKLESLASQFPTRLKLYFVLNQPPSSWSQGVGFINEKHIQHHLGYASSSIMILVCGPPAMTKAMMILLNKLGYKGEDIFKF